MEIKLQIVILYINTYHFRHHIQVTLDRSYIVHGLPNATEIGHEACGVSSCRWRDELQHCFDTGWTEVTRSHHSEQSWGSSPAVCPKNWHDYHLFLTEFFVLPGPLLGVGASRCLWARFSTIHVIFVTYPLVIIKRLLTCNPCQINHFSAIFASRDSKLYEI